MAGWHHWLDGRESEWTPGVGDGQGGLACCGSWGRKESDTTERLNWNELKGIYQKRLYCLLLTVALDTRWKENTESPAGLAHHTDDNSFWALLPPRHSAKCPNAWMHTVLGVARCGVSILRVRTLRPRKVKWLAVATVFRVAVLGFKSKSGL